MEELFEEEPDRYSSLLAQIYFGLAMNYKELGKKEEALQIFENTINLLEVLIEENKDAWQNLFFNTCLTSAQIYETEGQFEEILQVLSKIEDSLKTSYEENDEQYEGFYNYYNVLTAIANNGLGMITYKQEQYEKAIEYFSKARDCEEIYYEITGQRKPALATDYMNLAHSYNNLNKKQEALLNALKALSLREKLFNEDKKYANDFAYSNHFIGSLYYNEKLKGSLPFFKRYLDLKDYMDEKCYAVGVNNLMKVYDMEIEMEFDNIEKCRILHEDKIDAIKKYMNDADNYLHAYAMAHYRYGLYLHKKNEKDANKYLIQSIEYMEELVKEDNKKMLSLADFYQLVVPLVEPIDRAIDYAEKAVIILEKIVEEDKTQNRFLENAYVVLIGFYEKNNQVEEANHVKEKLEKLKGN